MWLGVWLLLWRGLPLKFFIISSSQSAEESHPSACGKWNLSLWDHLRRSASYLETRRHPALLRCRSHGVIFCAQRFASTRSLSFELVGWLFLPSVLPAELRVHPSALSHLGVRLLNVERGKTSTSYKIWFGLQCVKQRHPVFRERGALTRSLRIQWHEFDL